MNQPQIIAQQNCKVGRSYPKTNTCLPGVLCSPVDEFDMIEGCKDCNKKI